MSPKKEAIKDMRKEGVKYSVLNYAKNIKNTPEISVRAGLLGLSART